MDHCVGKLFASGKTRLQIERALGSIPYVWTLIFVLIFVLQLVHSDQNIISDTSKKRLKL